VSALDALPPIALPELLRRAALQYRLDRKYLVREVLAHRLIERLSDRVEALEIDGRRRFRYESCYFDTPHLRLYHDHRQGRRRRWKARTRSYLDSGECVFEVKLRGRRGATIKERASHRLARRSELTPSAEAFLARCLARHYGCAAPRMTAVLSTTYERATLAARDGAMRITLDSSLRCDGLGETVCAPPGLLVVEVKSVEVDTDADRALRALGAREVSMSKYCLAAAMLDPRLPANAWNRVLRELGRVRV
jgi:hypothetical protein